MVLCPCRMGILIFILCRIYCVDLCCFHSNTFQILIVSHLLLHADGHLLICHHRYNGWNSDDVICSHFLFVTLMLLFINALPLLLVFISTTEEEEAEVKKSKFYQPATKFVPVSPHVAAVSSSENKKSVSLCSLSVTCLVGWETLVWHVKIIYQVASSKFKN